MTEFFQQHRIIILVFVAPLLLFPPLLLLVRHILKSRPRAKKIATIVFIPSYLVLWFIWGALGGIAYLFEGATSGETPTSNIIGLDHINVWDIQSFEGSTYALVYVWTTFPDYMQRFDLYKYPGIKEEVERSDCKREYLILSENLVDDTKRTGKSGKLDFVKKTVTVKFDTGKNQVVSIKGL